ncbi:MAG TPA: cytochrome c oxidase assembly protein [Ilumatobacteraceae bacterium]
MHEIEVPVGLVGAAAVYAGLVIVARRHDAGAVPLRIQWSFFAGIGVLAAALTGPLDARAHRGFAPHMVQHLLIISVAAPLLAAGRPDRIARSAVGLNPATAPSVSRIATAALLQVVVLLSWHIPSVYETAARNDVLHGLEHLTLLLTSIVLWSELLHSVGAVRGAGLIALFLIGLPPMAFGVGLASAPNSWYSTYTLGDQQLAGVYMWAYGGAAATVGAVLLFATWLLSEQVEA